MNDFEIEADKITNKFSKEIFDLNSTLPYKRLSYGLGILGKLLRYEQRFKKFKNNNIRVKRRKRLYVF